ncbi:MAG: tRNA pseudouridine32 synthase/23S rRNA pseudouridine746 synthase [Thiomicrorhabdus sp.]|nr:MAG: tRNA pseudouridine32 synthase/23S rRNA pseudouridine746 synthase [Thiomicrorhabdus sp.]
MHTPISSPVLKPFKFDQSWIIYADDEIVIANKPSGLLSVPGRGPDKQECLLSHLQVRYPSIKVVHRLDMDTSGLMVLALNTESHRNLSRQFQERETAKTYHAICAGIAALPSGTIRLPMRCNWERRPLQMIDFKQGKHAETHWKVLTQAGDQFLVELTPITGRSHQLRLHMKSLGYPILGDNLYADPIALNMSCRLQLHASNLSFTHPSTQEWLAFSVVADFSLPSP